jgi:hypothetical protein
MYTVQSKLMLSLDVPETTNSPIGSCWLLLSGDVIFTSGDKDWAWAISSFNHELKTKNDPKTMVEKRNLMIDTHLSC